MAGGRRLDVLIPSVRLILGKDGGWWRASEIAVVTREIPAIVRAWHSVPNQETPVLEFAKTELCDREVSLRHISEDELEELIHDVLLGCIVPSRIRK